MVHLTRRNFMKLAVASGAFLATGEGAKTNALAGDVEVQSGQDFSPETGKERKAIPSCCWQCVTRCPNVGFVEDGRLVKIEGNPKSIRTEGFVCSKGQAAINQYTDPDRILYPMKRAGKRGEGKWKRVSWDDALGELGARMKKHYDAGKPELFGFHYGRMKASSSKAIGGWLASYGSKTKGNHTAICEGGKWSAQEMTWGGHFDNWDIDRTDFMLNFGSNILETHTNHIPVAHRVMRAKVDRGAKLVTFDVRMSNTAAKSDEWVPIKPGGDCAVLLAMCNVVLEKGLYKGRGEAFMKFVKATNTAEDTTANKIAALKKHCAQYTPAWASKISGVPAAKIEAIATAFAKAKAPCLITYRGAIAHYNGNEAERAAQMLASLTGSVDVPGGRCKAVGGSWKYPKGPKAPVSKGLKINDGHPDKGHALHASYPTHHMNHATLPMIKDGSAGRPDIYLWYCYTPAYANGDVQGNIDVLKDEKLLPYTVAVDPFYGDSAVYADLILPDASFIERWDWEDMVDPNQIGENGLRQPLVPPLGEARNFADVVVDLGKRIGFDMGWKDQEDFVRKSCEKTPKVKEAGGFEYMKKNGVLALGDTPKFESFKEVILDPKKQVCKVGDTVYDDLAEPEAICPYFGDDVVYDKDIGVWWHWKASKAKSEDEAKEKGYTATKSSYKGYIGQKIGNIVYKGFKPDKINKSGYMELYSPTLKKKGHAALPTYLSIPEQDSMKPGDLMLTTFKVCVQSHSRTQNCKYLTEIYHDNPGWLNPKDASAKGLKTGDKIKVTSPTGSITTTVLVTENVIPGVIAISHHLGHWAYGRYASGNKAPLAGDGDPDLKNKHWKNHGVHPNWVIPNSPDPINGQQRWMDTVVQVTKA